MLMNAYYDIGEVARETGLTQRGRRRIPLSLQKGRKLFERRPQSASTLASSESCQFALGSTSTLGQGYANILIAAGGDRLSSFQIRELFQGDLQGAEVNRLPIMSAAGRT